jgi:ubiquinone/menaquinone biosynthesis C-methylase UbiE
MELQQEQIREQAKQVWNKVSAGWEKWDQFIMEFLRPTGEVIIKKLEIKENDIVLDIAAGTGQPGLTIASIANKGKVIGTDLADEMLLIAAANAAAKGLTNYSTKAADVCKLPFEDNTFTKISCRMGFMFFPDMQLALNEIYRVLTPGGRLAISVWGASDKNFWSTAITDILNKYIDLPQVQPGAPGMFRCARPGLMTDIFAKAGFKHIGEQEMSGKVDFIDADTYWQNRIDLSESVIAALAKVDNNIIGTIKNEVYTVINANSINGHALLDYGVNIIWGEK